MTVTRPSTNFRTKQIVYSSGGELPYVGFEHLKESPDGWLYNIKRWCSLFDLRLPQLPRLADPSTQGVVESEYFASGVGSVIEGDLDIDRVDELFYNNERHWIPSIRHGTYYRYKSPFFLYGDNSRVQHIDPANNKDGKNYIELDVEPDMNSPILAATFKRNSRTKTPLYDTHIQQMAAFSGIYLDGEQQETVSAVGKISWDVVDFTKKEFIIDTTQAEKTILRFNRDYTEQHGVIPVVAEDLAACEIAGLSNGANYQTYRLSHFPVLADNSFHLYVTDGVTWEEWTQAASWFDLINGDLGYGSKLYFLDQDLGIVYFGSASQGGVPSLGKFVVVTYKSTLRIEYEEVNRKTNATALSADVNPLAQHINQGFVVITHDQLEAARITLSIDKPLIPFTNPKEYGPITVGSDYAVLIATVTNIDGVPIPGVEVGFEMFPSDIGFIAGSTSASSITNGRGEAFASYQPPVSADNLGFYTTVMRASTHSSYTAHKELILNSTDSGLVGKEEEIYLYQVLKDDILLGYDTINEYLYSNVDQPSWVVDSTTYERWKRETVEEYDLEAWPEVTNSYQTLPGRKVVVYKIDPSTDNYDATAVHPITGEDGAVVPVRPVLVDYIDDPGGEHHGKCRLIYPEDAVPDCGPNDGSNNIGGYWAVSSKVVNFKAHCESPYYNNTIYSNSVPARIGLPDYLKGEYVTELLKKIPFGWKLPTDLDNIAAGLDGATFITINPHVESWSGNNIQWGPHEILDLINGTSSGEWASTPFQSVGFNFAVTGSGSLGFQFEVVIP